MRNAQIMLAALLIVPTLLIAGTILPPTLSATFDQASISPGGYAHLTFTITNPNPVKLTDVEFYHDLSSLDMSVLSSVPGGCTGHNVTGATRGGSAGPSVITIYEATFSPNETCTYSYLVANTLDAELGVQGTTTSAISSTNGGTGSAASASITVVANAAPQLRGLTILSSGMSCSPPGPLGGDSFDLSAGSGSGVISFSNGTLYPSSQCNVRVKVQGFRLGLQINTTSAISSTNAGTGDAASASVAVGEQIFKNGFEQD